MSDFDPSLNDQALIAAIRKRLLREIDSSGGGAANSVINNYAPAGGSATSGTGHMGDDSSTTSGLMEKLMGNPGDYDYNVDIERENTPTGWTKKVHRYRQEKKKG